MALSYSVWGVDPDSWGPAHPPKNPMRQHPPMSHLIQIVNSLFIQLKLSFLRDGPDWKEARWSKKSYFVILKKKEGKIKRDAKHAEWLIIFCKAAFSCPRGVIARFPHFPW
jgi:hypothetical protein